MSVLHNGIIFFSVIKSAAISASAADAITVVIICAIVNIGPLSFGFGSFQHFEEHRSLGGSIISRLDNGAFVGLIYELLVFS